MQISNIPVKFELPFAADADSSHVTAPIPTPTQTGPNIGRASLTVGFPPITFVDPAAGGTWPQGRDFNGIGYMLSAPMQWVQAGGPWAYDSAFQTAIGGYPKGATIASAVTDGLIWRSVVDNNATNPDTGGAGWVAALAPTTLTFENLTGSAPGTDKTTSWAVDQILVASALGGVPSLLTSLTTAQLAFNGAASPGLGGMDVAGGTPTSGEVSWYLGYGPGSSTLGVFGTVACNGLVYTGAHLPAGVTQTRRLATGKTDGSANIVKFSQLDNDFLVPGGNVLISGIAAGPTVVSLAGFVPANAKSVTGTSQAGPGSSFIVGADSSLIGSIGLGATGTASQENSWWMMALSIAQTVYYARSAGSGGLTLTAARYSL